jgi:nicotinamide phosphoribosyltransferase
MNYNSIILDVDSYKHSQFAQYPKNTTHIFSYIESRGGEWDKAVFFGLQAYIKENMLTPITMQDIDEAEPIVLAHCGVFNRAGWEYIVRVHGGRLPVHIKAVPEGTILPTKNILMGIVNTDPECFWLTSFLETALLRAVWYPTTVATNSYETKKIVNTYLVESGDPLSIDFKLNDFGSRGVSSRESSGIGGAAHLINFLGTDNVPALMWARRYYNAEIAGFSIPAMEHSTVTSWGRENEVDSYRNMLQTYGKPGALLACVSDSYDIFNACKLWGTELKQEILDSGAVVVIRPDSGHPATIVLACVRILDLHFGHTVNEKGYKVLNNVRVIQGDGINHESIIEILNNLIVAGYSADNVAFGQGGALLQQINRDTMKFAMKCSAAKINGEWVDVFKDPITDQGKRSKKGMLALVKRNGEYVTIRAEERLAIEDDLLQTVFRDGVLFRDQTFEEVRQNAKNSI